MAIPIRPRTQGSLNFPLPRATSKRLTDWRLWVGLALVIGSTFAGQKILNSYDHGISALVVTRDLAPGQRITAGVVRLEKVSLPDTSSVIKSQDEIIGKIVQQPIFSGSVLDARMLTHRKNENLRALSIPLLAGHVPPLEVGALVDVWFTPSTDGVQLPGPARVLVKNAVITVPPSSQDSQMNTAITLEVKFNDVQRVVTAMRDGTLDVVAVGNSPHE